MKHALLCSLVLLLAVPAFAQAPAPAEPAPQPSVLATMTGVPDLWDMKLGWSAAAPERAIEMSAVTGGDQKTWLLSLHTRLMATLYTKQGSPYDAHLLVFQGQEVGMVLVDQAAQQIRFAIKSGSTWYLAKDMAGAEDIGQITLVNARVSGDSVTAQFSLETVSGTKTVDLKFSLK